MRPTGAKCSRPKGFAKTDYVLAAMGAGTFVVGCIYLGIIRSMLAHSRATPGPSRPPSSSWAAGAPEGRTSAACSLIEP